MIDFNLSNLKWCSLNNCNWCVSLDIGYMLPLNGAKLQYVDSYKYLGMLIHVRNDDLDIARQLTCVMMRTFSSCSV